MRLPNQTRRSFLFDLAGAGGLALADRIVHADTASADVVLRIGPVRVDIAKDCTIHTIGYNGSVPGPLIRVRENVPVTVEVLNDTDELEFVHWHGLICSAEVDGSEEEGSLSVPARGRLRYQLVPRPSGARFVHTHAMSMGNLNRGAFTGQFGFAYIEPAIDPGRYDQEVFLASHEWDPFLTTMEEDELEGGGHSKPELKEDAHGFEVAYRRFTINGRCLGHGEPVRVKEGQQVLFHFLNASATENIRLALPGHQFHVVALDGNAVPRPRPVGVLQLGTAERIDAVVTMDNPGVWILGTPSDAARRNGMGIVVEYANRTGEPRWIKPPKASWDYTVFGINRGAPKPDQVIPLVFRQLKAGADGFEQWSINGKQDGGPPLVLSRGTRYRLVFDNRSEDAHPVHLHRDSFELTNVYGTVTSGVMKDVVLVKPYGKIAADFTPTLDGLMLFHCHQQIHMEHGFKMLFNVS